jgi:hypothetical protein
MVDGFVIITTNATDSSENALIALYVIESVKLHSHSANQ